MALTQHPISRTVEVLTASAAVMELVVLSNAASADGRSCNQDGKSGDNGGGAEYAASSCPWGVRSRDRDRWFATKLEEGYAASAGDEGKGVASFGSVFSRVDEVIVGQCLAQLP